jgi:hypothetical protein
MVVSKRVAWFLVAFGVWSWIIWPTFLKNIWKDPRSWHHGMTAFFGVHLVLTIVSLTLGTIIGVLGILALRTRPRTIDAVGADRSVDEVRR